MAGIIVELILSWLLLCFFYKKHLSVVGFKPTRRRLYHLCAGLLIAASCCTLYQLLTTAWTDNYWVLNQQATGKTTGQNLWWTMVSVLYEEFLFRGALLYIAIRKLGMVKACMLSAIAFGVYHWFTFSVLGNPFMMLVTFLMTAVVGLSWAVAFAKTGALYLSTGLHAGWNIFFTVVFSNDPFHQGIFERANDHQLQGGLSWWVFLFQVMALPALTFLYLGWLSKKQRLPVYTKQEPYIPLEDEDHG